MASKSTPVVAVDTNIIVRFLTRDDEPQFQKSLALFKTRDLFIPDTVVLESEWVLRYAYDFEPAAIAEAFTKLFGLPNVRLTNPAQHAQAIQWNVAGLDFTDAFHLAQSHQYERLFTFDKKFISKAKGLCTCLVVEP